MRNLKLPGAAERRLQLIESLRLGSHTELCLVSVDGETVLLAVSPAGIVRIEAELTGPPDPDG